MRYYIAPQVAMTVTLAASLMFSFSARADTDTCLKMSSAAKNTMVARQMGAPMDDLIAMAQGLDVSSRERKFFISMIVDAYDYPKLRVEENKDEAIMEFAADYLIMCLKEEL